jgi:hypothetical protein
MQHCKSEGPEQYPATCVPEQADICLQVPLPCDVEQGLLVQHLISELPGHNPEVTLPEQQPPEIETQTPVIPPTL